MAYKDLFVGSAGLLTGHTSDSGHTYTVVSGGGTLSLSGLTPASVYESNATFGYARYLTNFTPAAANCDAWLQVKFKSFAGDQNFDVTLSDTGAFTSFGDTCYTVRTGVAAATGIPTHKVLKQVSGSETQLGTDVTGAAMTAGTAYNFRYTRRGGVITVYRDGVQACQQTDGSPIANGPVGFSIIAPSATSTTTGLHLMQAAASDPLTATVSGPSSGSNGVESTAFTVTLSQASVGPTVVNLASNGSGDVFRATSGGSTVTSTTVADGATTAAFYLVPGTTGARTITPTVADCVFTPTTLTYTSNSSTATTYTLTGPASGFKNNASTNFTVTPNGNYTGTVTITPSGGGLSTPIVKTFGGTSTPQTFTITPTSTGTVTLTPTNSGGLTNPANLSYTSNAQTLAAVPAALGTSATTTVTFTGGGTKWLTSAPTFTPSGVSGVSVGTVTVVSDTSATAPVTTGTATGTATFTDSTTSATTTGTVAATRYVVAEAPYGALFTGLTGSIGYTIYNASDGTVYQAHTYVGVYEIGTSGYYAVLIVVPLTLAAIVMFDPPPASGLDPYPREIEPYPVMLLAAIQAFNNTGQTTNLPANVQQVAGSTTAATNAALLYASFAVGVVSSDATPTATTCTANTTGSPGLSTAAGEYATPNSLLLWTSGAHKGKTNRITGDAVASGVHSFTFDALTTAPAVGDTFHILSHG